MFGDLMCLGPNENRPKSVAEVVKYIGIETQCKSYILGREYICSVQNSALVNDVTGHCHAITLTLNFTKVELEGNKV